MKNTGPQRAKLETLKPNPKNPRVIKDDKFQKLVQSIRAFPQMLEVRPIVCTPDGVVLGGNMRLRACKEAGLREVPVHVVAWLDSQQEEFIIKDNVGYGEWDWDILANEWDANQLEDWGLDVWTPEPEPEEGLTDPDEVPSIPEEPKTKPGDLYILGKHRLLCGDSTNAEHVARLMDGQKADMVFTDPPYGMYLKADFSKGMTLKGGRPMKGKHSTMNHKGHKHENVIGDHDDFDPKFISAALSLDAEEIFLWGADYYAELLPNRNKGSWVIWDKRVKSDGTAINQAMTTSEFETCWSKNKHQRLVCRMVHSGICSIENDKRVHPTQKPTQLAIWFFELWGIGKTLVVDLFLGSGSTLIAAEKTGRTCYGMEIDPKYCDVIVKRWEEFTGKKAELVS
jgi:DNA modification methylase